MKKLKDSENEEITNLLTQTKEKQLISEEEEKILINIMYGIIHY